VKERCIRLDTCLTLLVSQVSMYLTKKWSCGMVAAQSKSQAGKAGVCRYEDFEISEDETLDPPYDER
jgi:hypothetical protein